MTDKDTERISYFESLQGSFEQARNLGISQKDVISLLQQVYQPEEAVGNQERKDQGKNNGLLEKKLSMLTLEDLPKIPPSTSTKTVYGEVKSNDFAIPDEKSLTEIKKLIPEITSIISLAFQGVGFVSQQGESGFETSDMFGYFPSFLRADAIPSLEGTGLKKAREDLQKLIDSKAAPIYRDEQTLNYQVSGKNNNVVLFRDDQNPKQVQMLVRKAEPGSYFYPAPANPNWIRGIQCPLVVSFKNIESADELRELLRSNPVKTLHTLTAVVLSPGITTRFTTSQNQENVVEDGEIIDKGYKQNVTGLMYIPGGYEKPSLTEI